jgi:hypothetical protein
MSPEEQTDENAENMVGGDGRLRIDFGCLVPR